ncbi:MAG: hypothetical protein Q9209_007290 [Squamulea sp. 1 TL-2023]
MGCPADCLQSNPQVIESIFNYIESITKDFSPLRNLKVIESSGAPPAEHMLKKLQEEGVNLKQTYGCTELGPLMRTYPHDLSNPHIERMRFIPIPGIDTHVDMEPVDGNLYELVAHQGLPCAAEIWGFGLGKQVEPGKVFRSNDLFVRDEKTGEESWILQGRRDDMLIMASGVMNVEAIEVESAVKREGEGLVRAALLVGHGREKTGLLVEIAEKAHGEGTHEAVEKVVMKVNEGLKVRARIGSDMIIILERGKELPVGAKGNVRRKEANKMYQNEIETLYAK